MPRLQIILKSTKNSNNKVTYFYTSNAGPSVSVPDIWNAAKNLSSICASGIVTYCKLIRKADYADIRLTNILNTLINRIYLRIFKSLLIYGMRLWSQCNRYTDNDEDENDDDDDLKL